MSATMSPPMNELPTQTPKTPLSFLSLPRELRQQILLIAVADHVLPSRDYYNSVRFIRWYADLWADAMREVHQYIEADVDFVAAWMKKRYEDLEEGRWVGGDGKWSPL